MRVEKAIDLSTSRQRLRGIRSRGKESRSSIRKLRVIKFFTATESLTQPCLKIFTGAERKIELLNI